MNQSANSGFRSHFHSLKTALPRDHRLAPESSPDPILPPILRVFLLRVATQILHGLRVYLLRLATQVLHGIRVCLSCHVMSAQSHLFPVGGVGRQEDAHPEDVEVPLEDVAHVLLPQLHPLVLTVYGVERQQKRGCTRKRMQTRVEKKGAWGAGRGGMKKKRARNDKIRHHLNDRGQLQQKKNEEQMQS